MFVGDIVGVRINRGFVQTVVGVIMGVEPSQGLFSLLACSEYKRQGGTLEENAIDLLLEHQRLVRDNRDILLYGEAEGRDLESELICFLCSFVLSCVIFCEL